MSFSSNISLLHRFSIRLPSHCAAFFHSLSLVWFLCFLTTSADLLNIKLLIFKVKLNNALAALLFLYTFCVSRCFFLDRQFFQVFLFCLFSLVVSWIFGYNSVSCIGFILFFVFNYFCYFQLPMHAFFKTDYQLLLRLYFWSFWIVGLYASVQVFGSVFGLRLPFANQSIAFLARGQGFSYEPSYYALYITPYATYLTTQFFLQSKRERSAFGVVISNFFLLISTSTGCFFSYASFAACLIWFRWMGLIRNRSLGPFFLKLLASFAFIFVSLGSLYPELISAGFLKFFYKGFKHHSFMERWNLLVEYWNVFLERPFTGTGLGGATTYLIQKSQGYVDLLDPEIITGSAPLATNVTTEILGSLGLLGAFAFTYFLYAIYSTFRKSFKIPHLLEAERIDLIALAMSLCVLFFTLQFNGSIMRSYVWVHVGICVGYAKYLQVKYREVR